MTKKCIIDKILEDIKRKIKGTNANIPNGTWTTIGTLKEEYRPQIILSITGSTGSVNIPVLFTVTPNGVVQVYQIS